MKSGSIPLFILLMALIAPVLSSAGEVVIIANGDVPISSLAGEEVRQIFLGKRSAWGNGAKIVIAVQDGTDASDIFLQTYIMKNAYQYGIYWKKQVFTGRGKAPRSFSSDLEIVRFVSETPGAIGYVSSGTDTGKAKPIAVR